ncbi:acetyltransferase, GNAT family [Lachnospiraceae bacterium KM106-2]|nr:acetyltransferase, GNAT family [Lachnospiraceae bacterium KM106-2]
MKEIKTDRLVVRRFREEDAEDLYEYLSNPVVVKYEDYDPFTKEAAMGEAKRRAGDENFWAVCLKEGKVIGNLYFAKSEFNTWELGYVFNETYWGNGYATESARALIDDAFRNEGIHRVAAECNPENQASWKLMERLGMRREGHLKNNLYFNVDEKGNPIYQDTFLYGLLREEWK